MGELLEPVGGLDEFEAILGVRFRCRELLRNALTHSSARSPTMPCNERLEFLGDSVLGLVIADQLFRGHPDFSEGDLTQVKSVVVSSRTLAQVGDDLGFERFITLGKGIQRRQDVPPSMVAGVVEAVIGAVFLDQGMEEARRLVLRWLSSHVESVLADRGRQNFKSLLQNYAQRVYGITPTYRVVAETGPAHGKTFEIEAVIGRRAFAAGYGRNKKDAEQDAAEIALAAIEHEAEAGLPVLQSGTSMPVPWAGFFAVDRDAVPGAGQGLEVTPP